MISFTWVTKMMDDFFQGIDPTSGLINPDYKQQPANPRKCIECGKQHDTIIEDTTTGERLAEIAKCRDCIMFGVTVTLTEKVIFPMDETFSNTAEDLARMEKE